MHKVKIFKSVDSELIPLEEEVNSWIASSGAKVISITGNISGQTPKGPASSFSQSDVLVIVHYESKGD